MLTFDQRSDGIAVIVHDERAAPDRPLDAARIEGDLGAGLDALARWPALQGFVFASIGGGAGFAGSVLEELAHLRSAAEGAALARRTQALAARIASLPVPSVAALHGPCRGRGLALALAAHARIASGDERTRFALPEVRLGLVPGGGTTIRLPRLVGAGVALELLLGGREIASATALRHGLVDRLGTEERLIEDAAAFARSLAGAAPARRRGARPFRSGGVRNLFLSRNPIGRALLFRRARRRVLSRTRGNYPAPERLLEVVRGGLARGLEAGLVLEARAFGELAVSAESRALVRLFAARDERAGFSRGEGDSARASMVEGQPAAGEGASAMDSRFRGNDGNTRPARADGPTLPSPTAGRSSAMHGFRGNDGSWSGSDGEWRGNEGHENGDHFSSFPRKRESIADVAGEVTSKPATVADHPTVARGTSGTLAHAGHPLPSFPRKRESTRADVAGKAPSKWGSTYKRKIVAGSRQARRVNTVGILGAGPTGAGIAYVSAMHAGVEVRLAGHDAAARERGIARIRSVLDRQVQREDLTRARRDAVLNRVRAVAGRERLRGMDLVIDAEPGSLEDKRRTIAGLKGFEEGRVIYASSLASLSVARLASPCPHPGNVAGMRYSSPVEHMPLLEVVAGEQSSPQALATCVDFGRRQGKTVIVVRDAPAFYCARILAPWFNEALRQLSEGIPIESIDWALVDFGFPTGPFARLDDLGIDAGAGVSRVLHDAFGERMRPPPAFAKLIADGRFGRRSGRGFYSYEIRDGERRGAVDGSVYTTVQAWPAVTRPAAELAQRCALAMINEAAHCLGEGIVQSACDGDVGAVFGAGFPPFLGGPFRYVDALGAAYVVERLDAWAATHGDRFRPAPLLVEMAGRAGRFHPEED